MKLTKTVPLSSPFIEQDDIDAVVSVLKGRWLSFGPKLTEFETELARYTGTRYAVAMNSGTSALHLAVKALGIGPGDEVITPSFTFAASANCAVYEGATPIFVDIQRDTYNIDPKLVEQAITPRTKAIVAVDIFGRPADKDALLAIAHKHNIALIEDAAEALGTEYHGKKAGSFGSCGIFAFYPNKQITTGEGGALVTNDERIAALARSYRNQGRGEKEHWHEHLRIGYNYRISDINCALGLSQLHKIERILQLREKVAEAYTKRLEEIPGVTVPIMRMHNQRITWFVYVIEVDNRDGVMATLQARGVQCSAYFQPVHLQPCYRERGHSKGELPITELVSSRTLALPFHTTLHTDDIAYVCTQLADVLKQTGENT